MTEKWKPVVGKEGKYEVSDLGRVRSLDREIVVITRKGKPSTRRYKGKILTPGPNNSGHLSVVLGHGEYGSQVHQLVMEAFVGPRPEGQDIRHLDGNPTHNSLKNLCYGTRSDNILDVYSVGKAWRKLDAGQAREIKRLLTAGAKGRSIAKQFDVSESTISCIKRGRTFWWV